jgi:RNA polymerase sigma factor (sigma-70 family)
MDVESSIDLLQRAKAGDSAALDQLLQRYGPALKRWASGRLPRWARDAAETEDLVQDAILHSLKHVAKIEAARSGALFAYLRQSVLNRIRDDLRRASRHPAPLALDDTFPSSLLSPLEAAIGSEALARYETALASLSSADREALIGRLEFGYSFDELASVLGKPTPDAARMAVKRALTRLLAVLTADVRFSRL